MFSDLVVVLNKQEVDDENDPEFNKEVKFLSSGTCFDFNAIDDNLFIVGTEEGKVLEYSKCYSNQLLTSYDAHFMPIYAIKWNSFYKRVFITCSADWTIKIWDHRYKY